MTTLAINCPRCGLALAVQAGVGQQVACPQCATVLLLGGTAPPPAPAPASAEEAPKPKPDLDPKLARVAAKWEGRFDLTPSYWPHVVGPAVYAVLALSIGLGAGHFLWRAVFDPPADAVPPPGRPTPVARASPVPGTTLISIPSGATPTTEAPTGPAAGICFVLDCSRESSPVADRLKAELLRAVRALHRDQLFNVLLMEEGQGKLLSAEMLPATEANVGMVSRPLADAKFGGAADLAGTILTAAGLRPETVCLLTGAGLPAGGDEPVSAHNPENVRISVVAVARPKGESHKGFYALAKRNRGKLYFVDPYTDKASAKHTCRTCSALVDPGEQYCFSCELTGARYGNTIKPQ